MRKITFLGLMILTFLGCNKDETDETPSLETFKIFNSTNSPIQEPSMNSVKALEIDESNNVWIGANVSSGVLFKYNQLSDSWTVFGDEAFGDSIGIVNSIDFDQGNNIWVGTNDGIFKYDGAEWESVYSIHVGFLSIPLHGRSLHFDQSNTLWCTMGDRLHRYENGEWTQVDDFINTFVSYQIREIASDEAGNVWFGTSHGIVKYDGNGFTQIEHEPEFTEMNIYAVEPLAANKGWVGARESLYRLVDIDWQPMDSVVLENPLWGEQEWNVHSIATSEDNMIVGTWSVGLAIQQEGEFQFKRGNEFGIDTNRFQINDVEYDLNDNIWMVTRWGDLIVYNESGLK
jgi:ligand-binding sensor domain-containing protein